jgi:RNA 2',3'-cyclic 3'-phosphodiesterase
MEVSNKRMFFGLEASAPWPQTFPKGRLIEASARHATLAFLGSVNWARLFPLLEEIPKPLFKAGLAAVFDQLLFLPPRHPNVVSLHVDFLENTELVQAYQNELCVWLLENKFTPHKNEQGWLPHVTLARQPFDEASWKERFTPLPVVFRGLSLYESLGNSRYQVLWNFPLPLP